jgi:dipeptidase E
MKLFLYSLSLSEAQAAVLTQLVGKAAKDISFALIENAADVEEGSEAWLGQFREAIRSQGYQVEVVDLRHWRDNRTGLYEKLASKDVIWLGGGNTYYLRWLLKETGADDLIKALVKNGKVYAGWSAGAMVAGPTLQHIEAMETRMAAPEPILDGLRLTNVVVVPHIDSQHFIESAANGNARYETQFRNERCHNRLALVSGSTKSGPGASQDGDCRPNRSAG